MPAFQPYWGKPAVRNDRGERGNVGILRSSVRALVPTRLRGAISDGRRYRDSYALIPFRSTFDIPPEKRGFMPECSWQSQAAVS